MFDEVKKICYDPFVASMATAHLEERAENITGG
jgi:hypothetical protein